MYKIILISLWLLLSFAAEAGVTKAVKDNGLITISLSNKDPNVISVENDKIERFVALKGTLITYLDPKYGALTLKPSQALSNEPFSFFIFTHSGKRFTLLVAPMAIPSQDIVLIMSESDDK